MKFVHFTKKNRLVGKEIEIWSTYPPPYGGVSTHSMRLFHTLKTKYRIVFKNFNGKTHSPDEGILKVSNPIKEVIRNAFSRNKIIHLHSSRLFVWFVMLFYSRSSKVLVTIHNQNIRNQLTFFENIVVRLFLKRARYIFLNDEGFGNYLVERFDIERKKVIVVSAFIPPLASESRSLPEILDRFILEHDRIISTFAWKLYKVKNKDVYGIDHVVEAFSLLRSKLSSVGLIIILPIIGNKDHYELIKSRIRELELSDSILIYESFIQNGFDVWRQSDLFLRSTWTDIEGISIKEALWSGTKVIATDVVKRPEGVDLYTYGDIEKLSELMYANLSKSNESAVNCNVATGTSMIERIFDELINTGGNSSIISKIDQFRPRLTFHNKR